VLFDLVVDDATGAVFRQSLHPRFIELPTEAQQLIPINALVPVFVHCAERGKEREVIGTAGPL